MLIASHFSAFSFQPFDDALVVLHESRVLMLTARDRLCSKGILTWAEVKLLQNFGKDLLVWDAACSIGVHKD